MVRLDMNTKTQEQQTKDLAEFLAEEYVVSGEEEDDYRRATGKCSKHNAVLDTHLNCLKCDDRYR